ncbi:hypothetical protein PRIC1_007142 [Phytophthora ramorum]
MEDLLALLQQMAGRENQQQVRQFYSGRDSGGSASYSWNQRRKLFRQCRRGLLLCWKFLVAQLNDEKAMLSTGTRNLYFQLVGIIMERVEFHLPTNASDTEDAVPTRAKTPKAPGHTANNAGMGWLANSPTASMNGMDFGDDERDNSGSSATANSENVNAYANQNLGNDELARDAVECNAVRGVINGRCTRAPATLTPPHAADGGMRRGDAMEAATCCRFKW